MAGGLLSAEYENSIKPRLENAIDIALMYMGGELRGSLIESAAERVYAAYTPAMYFLQKRRGELVKDSSYVIKTAGSHTIEVENVAATQSGAGGEVNWVESGLHQGHAGARAFMEDGLKEYVASHADADLIYALSTLGF